jgi:hypothetical protein
MGSHKSRDDEIYEQGVHDGQQADALDQFSHSLVKGYSLNPRENEIYNRGYEYGVSHRPAAQSAPTRRERFRDEAASNGTVSSSENSSGCGQVIAILVGVGIAIAVALWLLVNVVLPVGLLNSAAILTILAVVFKERKTLFAGLALAGAGYMLVDIANGWLSANFVNHVVHTASWLTAFVYLNAAAAGASTWILVVPLVAKASSQADQLKMRLLTGGAIGAIVAVAFIPLLVYEFAPNPFRTPSLESTTASATHTPPMTADLGSQASGDKPSSSSAQMNAGAASETDSQSVGTWRRPKKEGIETGYLGIAKRSDGTFAVASMSIVDGHFKEDGPPILVEGRRVGGAFSNVQFENGHLYAKYRYHGIDSSWEEEYHLTLEGSQTIVCSITGKEGKVVQLLHKEDTTSPDTPFTPATTSPDPSISPPASVDNVLADQAVIDDPDGYTNVRSGRSSSSEIVAVVRAGEVFSTSRQAGNWWQVKTASGQVGFMYASRIRLRR